LRIGGDGGVQLLWAVDPTVEEGRVVMVMLRRYAGLKAAAVVEEGGDGHGAGIPG
jgi:hypothetical protein